MAGFEWSSDAVKSLAGQGDLYCRFCRNFSVTEGEQDNTADDSTLPFLAARSTAAPLSSSPSPPAPTPTESVEPSSAAFIGTPVTSIDLTQDGHPSPVPSSDDEPDLPNVFKKSEFLPRERL